jgi:hypothetical protein
MADMTAVPLVGLPEVNRLGSGRFRPMALAFRLISCISPIHPAHRRRTRILSAMSRMRVSDRAGRHPGPARQINTKMKDMPDVDHR